MKAAGRPVLPKTAAAAPLLLVLLLCLGTNADALYSPEDGVLILESLDQYNNELLEREGPALVRSGGGCDAGSKIAFRLHTPPPTPVTPAPNTNRQVEFFTPNCPHCVALAPEIRKVAANLAGIAAVAAVDCSQEAARKLCAQHVGKGFPTLKLVGADVKVNPYTGEPMKDVDEYKGG